MIHGFFLHNNKMQTILLILKLIEFQLEIKKDLHSKFADILLHILLKN